MSQAGEANTRAFRWIFGNVEFDESRWELVVAGVIVELERKPQLVLAYLLRHAGEVVTKDELLESVWEHQVVVEAALTNAVGKLRRALGEAAGEMILTVPKVGYRLAAQVSRRAVAVLPPESRLLVGESVPRRPHWKLSDRLARHGDGEVWRAVHAKTGDVRVFKFSLDGHQLSALKREVTLARVLRDSLGDRDDLVRIIDWDFEEAPFFLEAEYGGTALDIWADEGERLSRLSMAERVSLVSQVASAVAVAHDVGVLHKDLKPANVLVWERDGKPQARVADFGSGRLLDPDQLEKLGITQLGLTHTQSVSSDSLTGTPLYLAPEVVSGHAPSIKSDLYALGVILYQVVVGDLRQPLSPGWEARVVDPLVREDITLFANGDPARRPASAHELVMRLGSLEERRVRRDTERAVQDRIVANERRIALARARRPWAIAAFLVLVAGLAAAMFQARKWREAEAAERVARVQADRSLSMAEALNQFLTVDLLGKAQPEKGNKAKLTVAEAVDMAEPAIAGRFGSAPATEGTVRASMATLYMTLWELPKAEQQARKALAKLEVAGASTDVRLRTVGTLARVLAYQSRFKEANALIDSRLARPLSGASPTALAELHLQKCRIAMAENRYDVAITHCERSRVMLGADPDALRQAAIAQNLGMARLYSGDSAGAMDPLRRAVKLFEQANGPSHASVLNARSFLLQGLIMAEDPGAISFGERLLKDKIAIFGADEMSVATVRQALGDAHFSKGDYGGALAQYLEGQRIYRLTVGEDAPDYLYILIGAGEAARNLGTPDQALELLLSAEHLARKNLPPDNMFQSQIAYDVTMSELDLGKAPSQPERLKLIRADATGSVAVTAWPARVQLLEGRIALQAGNEAATLRLFEAALKKFDGNVEVEPDFQAARTFIRHGPGAKVSRTQ